MNNVKALVSDAVGFPMDAAAHSRKQAVIVRRGVSNPGYERVYLQVGKQIRESIWYGTND